MAHRKSCFEKEAYQIERAIREKLTLKTQDIQTISAINTAEKQVTWYTYLIKDFPSELRSYDETILDFNETVSEEIVAQTGQTPVQRRRSTKPSADPTKTTLVISFVQPIAENSRQKIRRQRLQTAKHRDQYSKFKQPTRAKHRDMADGVPEADTDMMPMVLEYVGGNNTTPLQMENLPAEGREEIMDEVMGGTEEEHLRNKTREPVVEQYQADVDGVASEYELAAKDEETTKDGTAPEVKKAAEDEQGAEDEQEIDDVEAIEDEEGAEHEEGAEDVDATESEQVAEDMEPAEDEETEYLEGNPWNEGFSGLGEQEIMEEFMQLKVSSNRNCGNLVLATRGRYFGGGTFCNTNPCQRQNYRLINRHIAFFYGTALIASILARYSSSVRMSAPSLIAGLAGPVAPAKYV
ncbi:hypothetical protein NLG97_g1271 [Lecanicillium saksenae]|uniref:Uncharacterized protein n=1 Tax=Lecanicillium saksenae TaxID=468837 RepID=A0ACC1R4V1_9HYPO|nr:hypothetical protein NLG97_g1271 [Lecanicillium saksenae]